MIWLVFGGKEEASVGKKLRSTKEGTQAFARAKPM